VVNLNIHLKTKDKVVEKPLMQARKYTTDYKIFWNKKALNVFYQNIDDLHNEMPLFISHDDISYLDIKGKFNQHNSWGLFEANRKDVWEKYGIYINKIQPYGKKNCLFGLTFTPKLAETQMRQKRHPEKYYSYVKWDIRFIEEFLNNK
jgi:hypothetical protein